MLSKISLPAETVYFNESCEEARQAVSEVLDAYNALLGKLSAEERGKLQRCVAMQGRVPSVNMPKWQSVLRPPIFRVCDGIAGVLKPPILAPPVLAGQWG